MSADGPSKEPEPSAVSSLVLKVILVLLAAPMVISLAILLFGIPVALFKAIGDFFGLK